MQNRPTFLPDGLVISSHLLDEAGDAEGLVDAAPSINFGFVESNF